MKKETLYYDKLYDQLYQDVCMEIQGLVSEHADPDERDECGLVNIKAPEGHYVEGWKITNVTANVLVANGNLYSFNAMPLDELCKLVDNLLATYSK